MIPDKMKAWVLTDYGRLELRKINVPELSDNQVLVEIDRGCICNGSDPGIYHGHEVYRPPLVFGHEASGRIVKKGNEVTEFHVGQRVCWWFAQGAFAEYQVITPAEVAMFEVPEALSGDESPVLELVLASCRAMMEFPPGEGRKSVTVCGLGPSGLILIQYAKALGYETVIGWDLYESRRRLALQLGCDLVYDPSELLNSDLNKLPQSDVGVIMMGDDLLNGEPTITMLMRTVRKGGLIISYGHPETGRRFSPYVFQSRNLWMRGPVNDMELIRRRGKEVIEMTADGRIRIWPLITKCVDFEELIPAFESIMNMPEKQIKIVLKWRDKK